MTNTYCLFDARHPLPTNLGAVASSFDFSDKSAIKTKLWGDALETLRKGGEVRLYVTGLTPALVEFIKDAVFITRLTQSEASYVSVWDKPTPEGKLILLHFDRDSNTYWEQEIC